MFFDENVAGMIYPEFIQAVHREISGIHSDFEERFSSRNVPTHTEDGIPIRKLYVSNLPPKTTRMDLFGMFSQYGYVKSCWLRMGEKGPNRTPSATYAFVTFTHASDAHRALQAPKHEKMLCGRPLRISPADSWHQPIGDELGRAARHSKEQSHDNETPQAIDPAKDNVVGCDKAVDVENTEADTAENTCSESKSEDEETEGCYNLMEVLNGDCLRHVLSFIPLVDLIRSERVSKNWQNILHEHYHGIRTYKTSWWSHESVKMTTAVLRCVLQRLDSLTRLHIDHHWSALNDRTAHAIGKFCPMLEELRVVSMNTQNWNPLFYGCKQLKSVSFYSCYKVTDNNLVHLVKNESCVECLTVANNSHVTGLFLTNSITEDTTPPKLNALSFYNCFSLQGTVLSAAAETLCNLKTLKLDACQSSLWRIIPEILKKLPKLEELSLCGYDSFDGSFIAPNCDPLCEALTTLGDLKTVNFSKNIYITNAVLKHLAKSCPKLESLNISACNSRKALIMTGTCINDDGIAAVCRMCVQLRHLDLSYLAQVTEAGVAAAAQCRLLMSLRVRGNVLLTAEPFVICLQSCHALEELDVCGCNNVSDALVEEALTELEVHPRHLLLRIGGTLAAQIYETFEQCRGPEMLSGEKLELNVDHLCSSPLRPDFVDIYDDGSDDSLDFDDLLRSDDELYDDDDDVFDLDDFEQLEMDSVPAFMFI